MHIDFSVVHYWMCFEQPLREAVLYVGQAFLYEQQLITVYPTLKFGLVAPSDTFGNSVLRYLIVQKLWHLSSRRFPLSSPTILYLIKLHTEIWFIKTNCCTQAKFTTQAGIMVTPSAALMASFLSMRLNPNNHLSTTRALTSTGSVLFISNWIQFHTQHFSVFWLVVNMLTSSDFQEWHINLLTSVCIHPVSTKVVHFLPFTNMSVISRALFFISLRSKLMLMTSPPRCFPWHSETTCSVFLHWKHCTIQWNHCDWSVATSECPCKQFQDKWLSPEHFWQMISCFHMG